MIINDTQDGYLLFCNQKEINRLLDWFDGYIENNEIEDIDKDMQITLRPKDRRKS